jgi:MFS family permease
MSAHARAETVEISTLQIAVVTIVVALAGFIFSSDLALAGIALPAIGRSLHLAPAQLSWVITATSLGFGAFLIVGGRASDAYGQRSVCLFGIALFSLASLLAAILTNFAMFLAARALQGVGAAMIAPSSFSMINTILPPGPARNRALGAFAVVQGISLLLAPFIGGAVTSAFGGRSIFLILPPVGAICLLLGWKFVPPPSRTTKIAVDPLGIALVILAPVLIMLSMSLLEHEGWTSSRGIALLGTGVTCALILFVLESRVRAPLMPPALFRYPNVAGGSVAMLLVIVSGSMIFITSNMFLQKGLGLSPYIAGLGMVPYGVISVASGRLCPLGLKRWSARTVVVFGLALEIAGCLWMSQVPDHSTYWANFIPGTLVAQLGPIMVMVSLLAMATSSVPEADQGGATAIALTAQQIGVSLGVAIAMTILGAVSGMEGFRLTYLTNAGIAALTVVFVLLCTKSLPVSSKRIGH